MNFAYRYYLLLLNNWNATYAGCGSCISNDLDKLASQLTLDTAASDQLGCCGKHGICSHEVLQDKVPGPIPRPNHKMVGRKASFKLSWGCNGDKNGQHKHDFVSFEKGDITTAERSNKQVGSLVLFNSFWNGREVGQKFLTKQLLPFSLSLMTNTLLSDLTEMGITTSNSAFYN